MTVSGHYTRSSLRLAVLLIWFHIALFAQAASIRTLSAGKRDSLPDSGLSSASWIWTAGPTEGNVAFLKTFPSASGRSAVSATIWMTAVGQFTLWVNGQPIGSSGPNTDDVQLFSAGLNGTINTFSVLAVNQANPGAPPPGLVAAIQVEYSDGSNEPLLSNGSWAVSSVIPSDFPVPGPADTANFVFATVIGPFGSAPWGNSSSIPAYIRPSGILLGSTWIWSTSTAITSAPAGIVGFRRTIITPTGKNAQTASVLITADDIFALWLNGQYIGAPPGVPDILWVQKFSLDISAAATNTFTVFVNNTIAAAGLVATITTQYSDGSSKVVGTDPDWLTGAFTSVSAFILQPDSALSAAVVLGTMGVAPWGEMLGIHDALAASAVPTSPFASGTLPPTAPQFSSTTTGPTRTSIPISSSATTSSSHSIGLIIGPVVGGLIFVVAIALVLLSWRRRRQHARDMALTSEPFDLANNASQRAASRQWGPTMGSVQTRFIPRRLKSGSDTNRVGDALPSDAGSGRRPDENSEEPPNYAE
ncbi:hypothetical protein C8F04DRAFT_1108645 [Mycena alexandri]|uniref:Uncharacterized protein n=1 Tax=Mycena alexandri TaxID=1745969 RepID=A0AAD6SSV0_9AGAR|nr:hypothetical protein C8F04DRAFT_1108645 [Mycena alexandri]